MYLTHLKNISLYVLGLGALLIVGIYLFSLLYSCFNKKTTKKTVTIVRGVPGIGKESYVVWREFENNDGGTYRISYWQNYFGRGKNYKYDPRLVKTAEMCSLNEYIKYLVSRIDRIYVLSTFEKTWQYEIYVTLAKIFRYECNIVEIECLDERELRYFQMRSKKNIPYDKCLRIFNEWEYDKRAILQEPYKDDCEGDSIPLYGSINEEELDSELEQYRKGYLQNDYDNEYNYHEYIRTNTVIPLISTYHKKYVGIRK
jgi:hypothetical protein